MPMTETAAPATNEAVEPVPAIARPFELDGGPVYSERPKGAQA